jgi:small subunit ribosomal protein S1
MTQNDATNDLGDTQANDQEQPENKMEALLNEEGLNIDFPKQGETRDGVIASISEGQILVSVGAKSEGIITGKEYEAIPAEILAELKVGSAIPVFIVTPEDQSGNLILSFVRAVEEQSWIDAERYLEDAESFTSSIVGYNKGGLLVPLGTIRGFIPASQLSISRRLAISGDSPEEKYRQMISESIDVRVIEVDRERRRLILSEKAASTETRDQIKDLILDDLKEGDVRTGKVTSLADFGAFVNINGADGLVHLSEISWDHISHPNEVLKVGQEVKVKIIAIDKDRRRIGLSLRQLKDDPWSSQVTDLKVGQLVEAEITRLTNFGAFAKLRLENKAKDLEGLIHISEISEHRIEHPKEVIHVGDIVTLRIIKIEEDVHRIGLSLRRVDSPAYADLDWQALSKEIGSTSSSGGEDISAHLKVEESEAVEEPETVEGPETVVEPEPVIESDTVVEPETVVESESVVEPETLVASESIEDTEVTEEPKSSEDPEVSEESKA